ncbi:MAG: TAXI family TRAP transporter solute-binding subunit [Methanomassiliicoccales archaeon]|nr:MAG: TAXI family TRAP transporter solute-binding subunit [Methanomassiliicoccales archaeon]
MTGKKGFKTWLVLVGLLVIGWTSIDTHASETPRKKTRIYYKGGSRFDQSPNEKTDTTKIATGQPKGTYFSVGNKLAEVVSKDVDKTVIEVVDTNGSIENLDKVKKNIYQFGIVQSDVLYFKDPNSRNPQEASQVRVVGAIYREPVYILVRSKLHLSGIQELRGKKVAVGLTGSGTKFTSETILGMFGITLAELKPQYNTYEQIANAFEDETIDAAFIVIAKIPRRIQELIGRNAYILKIDRSDLTQIASAHPNLYRLLDVYDPVYDPNNPGDGKREFRTISVTSVLIANSKTDPNIVYKLTEQLYKHIEDKENNVIDPNITNLLVDYPFVLYGERGNDKLFHKTTYNYYSNTPLWGGYTFDKVRPYILPVPFLLFLLFILFGPIVRKWPERIGFDRWPTWIRNRTWLCTIILFYSFVIVLSYIGLCYFELGIENPDITGKAADLGKVFLLYFKLGEVACITTGGKIVRDLTVLISALFGIGILGRLGVASAENKIREVLKMFPKNSYDHVLICNWTSKIDGVIAQLRSNAIRKKRRIIIIAQPDEKYETDMHPSTAKYPDVHIFPSDPTSVETFKHKDVNIWGAKAILILADDKYADDPDMRSLKILFAVKSVIKSAQKKPNIIVELSKPEPAIEDRMKKEGADKVISYADITHKLLAQAVITPGAINFVQEILTVEEKSNEVYELDIKEILQKIRNDYRDAGRECTYRDFANEIAKKYEKKYHDVITVIGVRSEGKLHINPKGKDFSKIYKDGTIDTAVVLAWEEPE